MKNFVIKYFKYLVLAALMYMPIFGHLNTMPIRIWDESRLAINAYEMLNDGDYIVTHFDGQPDMWNTKPPLLIWFQVMFMKLIGVNELAVRLPSAFSAFFICLALLFFSIRFLKQFWFGFIAIFILITSHGFINFHASRTGDYDAMLTLFTTLSGLLFFAFIETRNNKYLYFFFIATALAVLTKSITGLLFLPGLFIYILWERQFLDILKNKHFYFGLLIFILLVAGYYLLREMKNPGFLAAVKVNELGGRFLEVNENHHGDFFYYYYNFIDFQLKEWYFLIPVGLLVGFLQKNLKIKRLTLFSFIMSLTFLLVISIAKTKLEWYDVPMYPFLAIIIAVGIFFFFDIIRKWNWINRKLPWNFLLFVFLILIGFFPYQKIFKKTYLPQEYAWDKDFYEIGYYLKKALKGKLEIDGYYLLYDGYNAHNKFYLKILQDKGVNIDFKNWKNLSEGDQVIAFQKNVKEFVTTNYTIDSIQVDGNVIKYKIYERKQ